MKSWKTTVVGAIFGIGWGAFKMFVLKQPLTASDFQTAAGITLLGAFSKDSNVTGGTIPQNQNWLQKIVGKIF